MTAEDWQTVALVFAGVTIFALALLIVAIGCMDSLVDELKHERAMRRVRELEGIKAKNQVNVTVPRIDPRAVVRAMNAEARRTGRPTP